MPRSSSDKELDPPSGSAGRRVLDFAQGLFWPVLAIALIIYALRTEDWLFFAIWAVILGITTLIPWLKSRRHRRP
jgi:hypothetical protein